MILPQIRAAALAAALLALSVPAPQAQTATPAPPQTPAASTVMIGKIAPPGAIHRVTRPGAYGLSEPPQGDQYAIVNGYLVRIEAASGKILSALRPVERILD